MVRWVLPSLMLHFHSRIISNCVRKIDDLFARSQVYTTRRDVFYCVGKKKKTRLAFKNNNIKTRVGEKIRHFQSLKITRRAYTWVVRGPSPNYHRQF